MLFGAFREELTRIEKDFAKEYPSRKSTLEDVMVEIRGRLDLLERDVLETLFTIKNRNYGFRRKKV